MNYFKKFSVALFVLPLSIMAQDLDLSAKIPFDSNVRTGVLPNGLTYFIRKNAKPEKKVDLRLIIKAGSILETDEQQGLASLYCFDGCLHLLLNGNRIIRFETQLHSRYFEFHHASHPICIRQHCIQIQCLRAGCKCM